MKDRRACAAGLAAVLVMACSSGSDGPSEPTGSGGSAGMGGSGGSGAPPDGGDASTGSDAAGTVQGFFTVHAYLPALAAAGAGALTAVFTKTSPTSAAVGCTRRVVAGCNIDACPISNGGTSDAGLPMASPHAGGLTFSGVGVDVKISLQPDALGRYAPAGPPASGPAFLGGEAAKLVATGGEIPAFEIDTMYPLLLVLDKPAATVGQVLAPRTQDLSVVWSRGAPDVLFYLRGTSGDLMKPLSIGCLVASTDGSLTLPTAELSQFSAGTTFTLATFSKKSARAGQYAVDMYLGGEIVSPDRQYAVEIMLE